MNVIHWALNKKFSQSLTEQHIQGRVHLRWHDNEGDWSMNVMHWAIKNKFR